MLGSEGVELANRSSDLRWMSLRRLVRNVRFCSVVDVDVVVVVVVESGNGERRDDVDNRPPPPKNRFVVAVVNVVSGDNAKEVNK